MHLRPSSPSIDDDFVFNEMLTNWRRINLPLWRAPRRLLSIMSPENVDGTILVLFKFFLIFKGPNTV